MDLTFKSNSDGIGVIDWKNEIIYKSDLNDEMKNIVGKIYDRNSNILIHYRRASYPSANPNNKWDAMHPVHSRSVDNGERIYVRINNNLRKTKMQRTKIYIVHNGTIGEWFKKLGRNTDTQ